MTIRLFIAGWAYFFLTTLAQGQLPVKKPVAQSAQATPSLAAATQVWVAINPQECASCVAITHSYDFKRLGTTWAVVLPTKARRESATLLPALFGARAPQVPVVFSDSLYQRHCPDNVSRLILERKQQPVLRVALKALGESWALLRLADATAPPLAAQTRLLVSPTKQLWSERTTLRRAADRWFLLDHGTNSVSEYSIGAGTSGGLPADAAATPTHTWQPSQLTYAQWYKLYFGDTTGLHTSSRFLPDLEKVGRNQPVMQTLTAQSERNTATSLVLWFHALPKASGGCGVYPRGLLVELRDGHLLRTTALNTAAADSAGFKPAIGNYIWRNDSTIVSAVNPPVALLASRQIPTRPTVVEFVRRRGRFHWKHSLPTVVRPKLFQRDQQLVGDYVALVPDFYYAHPYLFFRFANDIQDTSGAGSFSLPFFSDTHNDFNLRRNHNEARISYQVEAVSRLSSGNYLLIVKQDDAVHALVLDEYLTLLADAALPASAVTVKTWAVSPTGMATGFAPATGQLLTYQLL